MNPNGLRFDRNVYRDISLMPRLEELYRMGLGPQIVERVISEFNFIVEECQDQDELMHILLEEIVEHSLLASFYEELFLVSAEHQEVCFELVERFDMDVEWREQNISNMATDHINYIQSSGFCHGCMNCDDHEDVDDIIPFWLTKDIDFFKQLYFGMRGVILALELIKDDAVKGGHQELRFVERETLTELREAFFKDFTSMIRKSSVA